MTVVTTQVAYTRNGHVLWRDTGEHIVARLRGSGPDQTALLRGGSAILWRLLGTPRRVPDLAAQIGSNGQGPSEHEITAALVDLTASGLVRPIQGAD